MSSQISERRLPEAVTGGANKNDLLNTSVLATGSRARKAATAVGGLVLGATVVAALNGCNVAPDAGAAAEPTTTTTAPAGSETQTANPETSPYATAEQVNQAIADMQNAAKNNPALKKQLEQDAANVQTRHVGMTAKLGVYHGIESSQDPTGYSTTSKVGIIVKEAIQLDKYTTVLLSYTEDTQGDIVALPILYTGSHAVNENGVDFSLPTVSAQEIAKLINDGVSNHRIYFATMEFWLDSSNNDSQLHRTANTATADGLVGLRPMPKYDVTNLNSLPNLEGNTHSVDLNIYTLDPQQG